MRIIAYTEIAQGKPFHNFGPAWEHHLSGISNPAKYCASLCAWNLLYRILREQKVCDIPNIEFTATGKPCFVDSPLHFSISHSGKLCAVSLADVPTGVDVEIVRKAYSPSLIKRTISNEELVDYDGDFTKLWCRKESVAKLTGVGLNGYPCKINTLNPSYKYAEYCLRDHEYTDYRLVAVFMHDLESVQLIRL